MKKESDVKKVVRQHFDKHGWYWWMPPANGYGKAGIADFNALKNGVFIAVETKFGTNVPTPRQKAFLQSVWAEKGFGFVVDESNLEWLDAWLGAFDKATGAVLDAGSATKPEDAVDQNDGAVMLNAIAALTEKLK